MKLVFLLTAMAALQTATISRSFLTAVQREYWASAARADGLPYLFTAFQEQLGLKLDATKARVDMLVIDKASKPSEN